MKGLFDDLPLQPQDVPELKQASEGIRDKEGAVDLLTLPVSADDLRGDAGTAETGPSHCIDCERFSLRTDAKLGIHGFGGCAIGKAYEFKSALYPRRCASFKALPAATAAERRLWLAMRHNEGEAESARRSTENHHQDTPAMADRD